MFADEKKYVFIIFYYFTSILNCNKFSTKVGLEKVVFFILFLHSSEEMNVDIYC